MPPTDRLSVEAPFPNLNSVLFAAMPFALMIVKAPLLSDEPSTETFTTLVPVMAAAPVPPATTSWSAPVLASSRFRMLEVSVSGAAANDAFWFRLNVPIAPSTMLKAAWEGSVSVAPAVPAPVVPAEVAPEPGSAANVAPEATEIAVFARLPVAPKASVPPETTVVPV